jgi:hypothetical protein
MVRIARNMAIDFLRKHRREDLSDRMEDAGEQSEGDSYGRSIYGGDTTSQVEDEVISDLSLQEALSVLNEKEREVLKSFVKYVERKLEVAYGEKFELITQDYHQMLEEFIQNLNDVSKKTLNGSLNDRRDIKSELERMDKIIKEYKSTQDEDKKEKLRDSYERAKMMYNVSVGMLLEKLPELIVNKVLVDIAKKTLEQTQNKKR